METTEVLSDYEKERGKPLPSLNHSLTQTALLLALSEYRSRYSFPSELTLDLDGLRVTPDICIYPHLDANFMQDEIHMTEPPLVAVEIASPSQSTQDLVDKIRDMLAAGVQSCWLVQPAMQTITVYARGAEPKTFSEGTLIDPATDVELSVEDVFSNA